MNTQDRVTGISSMATRHVLAELGDVYQRRSGYGVACESVGGVEAARRIVAGEPFDFTVLAADAIGQLEASGHVVPGSRIDLVRSGAAIAVATGTPHPDIGNELAVRRAVLAARSIGYSTGPSGAHLTRLFDRWGISQAVEARMVKAPPGVPVGTLLARGDAELGFQQLSELLHLEGIEVVGPLPPEIQAMTTFSGAVCAAAARPDIARELLAFLASREADGAIRRQGMEPATAPSGVD